MEPINKYSREAKHKFGARKFEVSFIIEEQNDVMLEDMLSLINEILHKAHPRVFEEDMDMEYCEIDRREGDD